MSAAGGFVDRFNRARRKLREVPCPECGQSLTVEQPERALHIARCAGVGSGLLQPADRKRLAELEQRVQRGIRAFIEVGEALVEIRDSRLYRENYPSFKVYCAERWNMTRAQAYRLIDAYEVIEQVSPIGDISALRESHVRPLVPLTPEQQQLVYSVVVGTAPDGKITGAHVRSVVMVLQEIVQTGSVDDGTGQAIPIAQASTEHLKAAITEETYERMQRQAEHIKDRMNHHTRLITRTAWSSAEEFAAALPVLTELLHTSSSLHVEIIIREVLA